MRSSTATSSDARRERDGLCDTASAVGPDAATLCAGWTVRDLLVHLAVRDGRPDVLVGEALPPLRGRADRVLAALSAQPFEQLVAQVRGGPHGPARLAPVDGLVNSSEFFVHHEDIRRAQPGWAPRELPAARSASLWRTVKVMGRVAYRRAGVGVVLVTPSGPRAVVRPGAQAVALTGEPAELLLHAFGRRGHARVVADGTPAALARFTATFPDQTPPEDGSARG